jgi:hypothetical protein
VKILRQSDKDPTLSQARERMGHPQEMGGQNHRAKTENDFDIDNTRVKCCHLQPEKRDL